MKFIKSVAVLVLFIVVFFVLALALQLSIRPFLLFLINHGFYYEGILDGGDMVATFAATTGAFVASKQLKLKLFNNGIFGGVVLVMKKYAVAVPVYLGALVVTWFTLIAFTPLFLSSLEPKYSDGLANIGGIIALVVAYLVTKLVVKALYSSEQLVDTNTEPAII